MIYQRIVRDDRGIAIVAVTMVLVVAALLGGSMIAQTTQENWLAQWAYEDKEALYLAESGKEQGYREMKDNANFFDEVQEGEIEPGVLTGITIPGGTYDLEVNELVEGPPQVIEIIGTGDSGLGKRRQVIVTAGVEKENVNVWNNAIFGGSGQTGGVINGNCAIYGSVHLLGENVGVGNNSIEALDLSGTALIHNNYQGMSATLAAKVPPLTANDAGLDTLNAKLRVKNGAVGVSGNSEIGEAPVVGADYTTAMAGIYIETDHDATRWTGNQVDADGVPIPGHVFSDNGIDALYDLGDALTMPVTTDPYAGYGTYDAFFSEPRVLEIPASLTLDNSNAALTQVQAIFTPAYRAAHNVTLTVAGSAFTLRQTGTDADGNPTTNTFGYNPVAAAGKARITIDGMVEVQGNLSIGKKNVNVDYQGRGTIYTSGNGSAAGDVAVHSNLLPVTTFPTVDVIGIVAKHDMLLATGGGDSQLKMAGAFYGQNQAVSRKQNEIAGTFVCTYFDMGTNVPKIFQCPDLIDNLPPGIIGGDPIWMITNFEQRSWRTDLLP